MIQFRANELICAAFEAINVSDRNPPHPYYRKEIMDTAFGTKILNRKDNSIGLLIKTWLNEYTLSIIIENFLIKIRPFYQKSQKTFLKVVRLYSVH